ncbi:MAG: hypothetical protein K0R14_1177 [Burkholderiales bacterium]|jgi:hypothetical protein|nr:hypothetical protein [Burkholderiales bacterium]
MKKLLLISSFILLSSLAFAGSKKHSKSSNNDETTMTSIPAELASNVRYDWSQDDRNTRVVLKVANYNASPITVNSVTVKYQDGDKIKTCLDESPDVAIQPQKMVLTGKMELNCLGITKRVTYSSASTPQIAHAQEDAKTIVRDVMVNVKYIDANGAPAEQNSTVSLMFAKYFK